MMGEVFSYPYDREEYLALGIAMFYRLLHHALDTSRFAGCGIWYRRFSAVKRRINNTARGSSF